MELTNRKLFVILACLALAVGAFVMLWRPPAALPETVKPAEKTEQAAEVQVAAPEPAVVESLIVAPVVTDVAKTGRVTLLDDLTRRWDEAGAALKGEELLEKQRELTREAVGLGASDELLSFLGSLKSKGANDRWQQLLDEAGPVLFSGANAAAARDWLVRVADLKVREALCFHAGRGFAGTDLKGFIDRFQPDQHSESAVLTGYCTNLAKTDPEAAVKTFLELRPSNVDFTGFVNVMESLPATADFIKIAGDIPADARGTLARKARGALLQTWATSKPEDAAQYVLSNGTLAGADQMALVTERWAAKTPEAAEAWVQQLSPGRLRDEGTAGLARYWSGKNPLMAWEHAGRVDDFDKRVEVATAVFKEWQKTDAPAATQAWAALFPRTK